MYWKVPANVFHSVNCWWSLKLVVLCKATNVLVCRVEGVPAGQRLAGQCADYLITVCKVDWFKVKVHTLMPQWKSGDTVLLFGLFLIVGSKLSEDSCGLHVRAGEGGLVWIVLLQRSRPASSLARVREDVLQPVKGIELCEEERGKTVPNMGIQCTTTPHQAHRQLLQTLPQNQEGNTSAPEVVKPLDKLCRAFGFVVLVGDSTKDVKLYGLSY